MTDRIPRHSRVDSRSAQLLESTPDDVVIYAGLLYDDFGAGGHVMILQHVKPTSGIGPAEWLITIGGAVFILALVVSAIFIPEIRWLHVFQASIYVFTILLSLRHSRWGHFTGISAAGFSRPKAIVMFSEAIRR